MQYLVTVLYNDCEQEFICDKMMYNPKNHSIIMLQDNDTVTVENVRKIKVERYNLTEKLLRDSIKNMKETLN
jgi:hypothetical protein